MKIDDRYVGLILIALGIGVFLVAQTFPLMAGMPYGPGFFPSIAAVGLVVCGLVITLSGTMKARAAAPAPIAETADTAGSGMLRPFLIALCVIFFGLAMPVLGFHITATITVAAVALIFGAGPVTAIVLAVAAAFATHAAFYSMLRVPLSWGVLTPYAW
ncbi:MAG: hypothetical protein AcusKO_00900 [Acuticoccus sp.]